MTHVTCEGLFYLCQEHFVWINFKFPYLQFNYYNFSHPGDNEQRCQCCK